MIYPGIYSYNAPFRGPKESKEISKFFVSVVHDISVGAGEITEQATQAEDNLIFCLNSGRQPGAGLQTAATINGENFAYQGVWAVSTRINATEAIVDRILEDL